MADRTGNEVEIELAADDAEAEAEEAGRLTANLRRELRQPDAAGQHFHIPVFQTTLRSPCARQPGGVRQSLIILGMSG